MRSLAIASLSFLAVGAASAQPAAPTAPVGPPKAFSGMGYSQPDITPGLCQTVSPKETRCTIPQMTAGRYLIAASATSTATADGAQQQLTIVVGDTNCIQAASNPKAKPWSSGPQTLKLVCIVQILSDQTTLVRAIYADAKATADKAGPQLSFRRLPWNPVISSSGLVPQQ